MLNFLLLIILLSQNGSLSSSFGNENSESAQYEQFNDPLKDIRRNTVLYNKYLSTGCFPNKFYDYTHSFKIDNINIKYYTGINLSLKNYNDSNSYSFDIPLQVQFCLNENFGFTEVIKIHAGHTGAKTDDQKIVGFLPGFEIPVNEYFIYFKHDRLNIEAGRMRIFWGPGNYSSVFISDNLDFDMLRINYISEIFTFENVIAVLDYNRNSYIAAQRFEVRLLSGKLLLGINEAVVWSNYFSGYYLNPVSPYYLVQRYMGEGNNNILGGADIQFIFRNSARIYLQGMVDDVSFSPPEPPERLGFLGGVNFYNIFNINYFDITSEISGVAPYTYSHFDYRENIEKNGFYRNDTAVGHILGNNFWDGKFEISWKNNLVELSSLFGYTIQGQYCLPDPWTWEKESNPSWPSGIIEKKTYVKIRTIFNINKFEIMFSSTYEDFRNYKWVENRNSSNKSFGLNIFYEF